MRAENIPGAKNPCAFTFDAFRQRQDRRCEGLNREGVSATIIGITPPSTVELPLPQVWENPCIPGESNHELETRISYRATTLFEAGKLKNVFRAVFLPLYNVNPLVHPRYGGRVGILRS